MIPKTIHYCWFGRNPLPRSAERCIASWRKFFPDYEIKEWNEDNFDVNIIPYTRQAYEAKKYAFVSDYARFWILYHYGGLYFDTDVEVIKPFDDILAKGAFMGVEAGAVVRHDDEQTLAVAPGLGLGVNPGLGLYKELLDYYDDLNFVDGSGRQIGGTIVTHTTRVLHRYGLPNEVSEPVEVAGVWIYPSDYFCPMDSTTGITVVTPRTVSIHHYDCSWMDHDTFSWRLHLLKNRINRLLGSRFANILNRIIH
ncbi:MAG: glycosyl transferase [Prevotella sp.]|nr:glycosyl transferase [Prevotella sp.]